MMRFALGFACALLIVAAGAAGAVWFGLVPARADDKPGSLERFAARHALRATIGREMPQPPYPLSPSDADLTAGAKLYVAQCIDCHGSGGTSGPSNIAKGLGVEPPQFATDDVTDDPEGETYWKIEHGIRFTGMPAYAGLLTEKEIWQIAFFLKRAAKDLPPAAQAVWNAKPR